MVNPRMSQFDNSLERLRRYQTLAVPFARAVLVECLNSHAQPKVSRGFLPEGCPRATAGDWESKPARLPAWPPRRSDRKPWQGCGRARETARAASDWLSLLRSRGPSQARRRRFRFCERAPLISRITASTILRLPRVENLMWKGTESAPGHRRIAKWMGQYADE